MAFALHCGAGSYTSPSRNESYRGLLSDASDLAARLLREGAPAESIVTSVVQLLEESPLTNAGPGANLTRQGTLECDALCATLTKTNPGSVSFGAVAAAPGLASPCTVAHAVMKSKPNTCICGIEAWKFAKDHGLVCAKDEDSLRTYGVTSAAQNRWLQAYQRHADQVDHETKRSKCSDTVGCVCIDHEGRIAGCVSSGGPVFKDVGRIGPASVYGAALALDEKLLGVCASGNGEYILQEIPSLKALGADKLESIVEEDQTLALLRLSLLDTKDDYIVDWAFSSPGFAFAFGNSKGRVRILIDVRSKQQRIRAGSEKINNAEKD